jgi:hypothetical protein
MMRFHPSADRAGFEPDLFARDVSKIDANRTRMPVQIRQRHPEDAAQNRREVGSGSNNTIGAPSFSPYRPHSPFRRFAHSPCRRVAVSPIRRLAAFALVPREIFHLLLMTTIILSTYGHNGARRIRFQNRR